MKGPWPLDGPSAIRYSIGHSGPEVRALGEVGMRAVQRALDHVQRCAGGGDACGESSTLAAQNRGAGGRVSTGDHVADFVETQSGFLAPQNDPYPVQIIVSIAAAAPGDPSRREQAPRFPVSQHVGGQAEPLSDPSDAEFGG